MGTRSLDNIRLALRITAVIQNELTDETVVTFDQPNLSYTKTLTSGVEKDQANRAWQYSGALASGHQVIYDLNTMAGIDIGAGVGKDALGQTVDFENIVAICIQNDNAVATAGDLEVEPAASEGWAAIGSHTVANDGALKGQGILFKSQLAEGGFDIDPELSHRITLRASGGDVDYTIYALARDRDYGSSSSASSPSSSSSSSRSSSSSSKSSSVSSSSSSSESSLSSSSASSPSSSSSSSSMSSSSISSFSSVSSVSSSSSSTSSASSSSSSKSSSSPSSASSSISTSSISTSSSSPSSGSSSSSSEISLSSQSSPSSISSSISTSSSSFSTNWAGSAPIVSVTVSYTYGDSYHNPQWLMFYRTYATVGFPESGTWTLTFDGQTTAAIGVPITFSEVKAKLEALSTIGGVGGEVLITSDNPGYLMITFYGNLAGQVLSLLSVDYSNLRYEIESSSSASSSSVSSSSISTSTSSSPSSSSPSSSSYSQSSVSSSSWSSASSPSSSSPSSVSSSSSSQSTSTSSVSSSSSSSASVSSSSSPSSSSSESSSSLSSQSSISTSSVSSSSSS